MTTSEMDNVDLLIRSFEHKRRAGSKLLRKAVQEAEEALEIVDSSSLPHGRIGTRSPNAVESLAKKRQSSTPPDIAGSIHGSDSASSSSDLPHASSPGPHRRRDRNERQHSDAPCSFSGSTAIFPKRISGTAETEASPEGNARDADQLASAAGGSSDCCSVYNSRHSDGRYDYCFTAVEKALAWRRRRRRLVVANAPILLPTRPTVGERAPPPVTEEVREEVIGETARWDISTAGVECRGMFNQLAYESVVVESAGTEQWPDSQSEVNAAAMVAGEQAKKIVVCTTENSTGIENDDNVEQIGEHQSRESFTKQIGRHVAMGWMKIGSAAVRPRPGEILSDERRRWYGTQYREGGVEREIESGPQYEQKETRLERYTEWLKHHPARQHECADVSDKVPERESTPSPLPSAPSPIECLIRGTRTRVSNPARIRGSRAMTDSVAPCRIDCTLSLPGSTKQDVDSAIIVGHPFEGIDSARDARPRQQSSLNVGRSDTRWRPLAHAASRSNSDELGGGACPLNVAKRQSCASTLSPLIRRDAEEKTRLHTVTSAHRISEETVDGYDAKGGGCDCGHGHAGVSWSQGLALDWAGQSTQGAVKLNFGASFGVESEHRDTFTTQEIATGRALPVESGTNAMPTTPAQSLSPFTEEVMVREVRENVATVNAASSEAHRRDVNKTSASKLSVPGATTIVEQQGCAVHILRPWLTKMAVNCHARKNKVQETEKRTEFMDERHSEPSSHTLKIPLSGPIAEVANVITDDSGTASFEERRWSRRVGTSIVVGADVCTSPTSATGKETHNVPYISACVQNGSIPSPCMLFGIRFGPKQEHSLQSKKAVAFTHSDCRSEKKKSLECSAAGYNDATGVITIKDEQKRLRTVNERSLVVGTGIPADPKPLSVTTACGVKTCAASAGVSASLGFSSYNATPQEGSMRPFFPQQPAKRQPPASTSECSPWDVVMSSASSSRISPSAAAGVAGSSHAKSPIVGPRRNQRVAMELQVKKTIGNSGQLDKRSISWGTSAIFPSSTVSSKLSPPSLKEVATTAGSFEAQQTPVAGEIPPILTVSEATCNSSTSGWDQRTAIIRTDSLPPAGRDDGRVNSRNTTEAVTMRPIRTLDEKEVRCHQSPVRGGFVGVSNCAAFLPRSTVPAVIVSMEQKAGKGAAKRVSTFEAQQPVSGVVSSNEIHDAEHFSRSGNGKMGVADGRRADDDVLSFRSPPSLSSTKETFETCDDAGHDGPFGGDSAFNETMGEGNAASSRRPMTLIHVLRATTSKNPRICHPSARYEEPGVVAKNASSYRSAAKDSTAVFPADLPRQVETVLALLAKCQGTTARRGSRSVRSSFNNPLLETFGVDNPLLGPSSVDGSDGVKDYFQKSSAA